MYEKLNFKYARDSLGYLIQKFKISELYIPYYLCDVIRHRVFKEGCKPVFYHINDSFYPTTKFKEDSFILYPNYFGICEDNVNNLEKCYPNLIVDNAHASEAVIIELPNTEELLLIPENLLQTRLFFCIIFPFFFIVFLNNSSKNNTNFTKLNN